ncbi:phosphatase PAP2 family protein [Marinobacter halodurans]|uniref:undecaprenyl-diphosphate phosphatase n=1 Tax=Marinobacter halodurans TaxID=2528979 RepID=A0ABY1ZHP5_9GAMM|nr:phosphatase PAP2 family protein [Marinobacter halodurans]TBW53327.1 phosphatase PAP2 family protein [Marinobacter halodurans]
MYGLDDLATRTLNHLSGHSPIMDGFMILLSEVGIPLMVALVVAQWWVRTSREHTRHVLVSSGLTFLLGLALNQVILLFVHRMRPYDAGLTHLLVAPNPDYSFPSDHATASFAIAAAFLVHRFYRRGLAFLIVAFLIAFSRVYIGIHYLTDVIGGATTGLLAAYLVRKFYREGNWLDQRLTRIG